MKYTARITGAPSKYMDVVKMFRTIGHKQAVEVVVDEQKHIEALRMGIRSALVKDGQDAAAISSLKDGSKLFFYKNGGHNE